MRFYGPNQAARTRLISFVGTLPHLLDYGHPRQKGAPKLCDYPLAAADPVKDTTGVGRTWNAMRPFGEDYRRRILNQLNRGENRHGLAGRIFHRQQGDSTRPTGKAKTTSSAPSAWSSRPSFLWNTRYLDRAVNYLLDQGRTVAIDDIARLSPLIHDHINLHGRHKFTLDGPTAHGHLRPLNSV